MAIRAHTLTTALLSLLLLCSCQRNCEELEPKITYFPNPVLIESRPSAFTGLTPQDGHSEWGKELRVAYAFANEQDYYRAITAFKRALVFLPHSQVDRKFQIEYDIVHAYYLGYKYKGAIEAFEESSLPTVPIEFPAFRQLLIILYESYIKISREEKALEILKTIECFFPDDAEKLRLGTALLNADFPAATQIAECRSDSVEIKAFLSEYSCAAKSASRAQLYQAILPGAGYLYVGQKKAALTSLIINTLFVWASYRCFDRGDFAAGMITASLETGWYFGGINGARLAAKEYNERLYEVNGREFMRCHSFFPVLMLETRF
jgi:tetratricopeptide (TPR) repeat protein